MCSSDLSPPAKERQASEAAVVKVIVESLRDQDADVRWAAVHALGTMKAPEAVTLLTTLLRAPEAGLRRDAATALGRIGLAARPAIPALKALLQDRDATVFRAADEALQKIEAVNPANPALRALYGGPGTNQNFMDPFTMPPGNRQPGQQPRSTIVPPPTFPRGALPKPKGGQPSRPPFFPPR